MGSNRRSGVRSRRSDAAGSTPGGTGSFLGQLGLFETGNGLAHGPGLIVLAFAVALVVYPIRRLVRFLRRG
jgi:hypothetical protein